VNDHIFQALLITIQKWDLHNIKSIQKYKIHGNTAPVADYITGSPSTFCHGSGRDGSSSMFSF